MVEWRPDQSFVFWVGSPMGEFDWIIYCRVVMAIYQENPENNALQDSLTQTCVMKASRITTQKAIRSS